MRDVHVQAVIIGAAVLSLLGALEGPALVTRWRADRTARQLVRAMHEADSVTMARLSLRASATNLLCARRHWPAAFWSYKDQESELVLVSRYAGDFQYRALGEELPPMGKRAEFEFLVTRKQPGKVASYTAPPALYFQEGYRDCLVP